MSPPARYCGRDFSEVDLALIRRLAETLPTRRAIADALCDELSWQRPDGRRKDMSARVALLRMEADGLIGLPPPRNRNGNGRLARHQEPQPQLALSFPETLEGLGRIELDLVSTSAQSRRWRELVASYHYLGYTPFAGAQLRYLVECPSGTLGALGFAASAWSCAPRDAHIGWDAPTREARLHLVVGNAHFLIVPEVRVKNLASFVLGAAARRLAGDWVSTYGYAPVLLETFVERGRFVGTSYQAANWIYVGMTKGRGKLDRENRHALPVKDVYLYPLRRDYRRVLTAPR
ncbi:MAG: Druantia anti-phage system protein DruA [Acidimicrobiales bacterium]